jgi:hypothetical protein
MQLRPTALPHWLAAAGAAADC